MADKHDVSPAACCQPDESKDNSEGKTVDVASETKPEDIQSQEELSKLLPTIMEALCLDLTNAKEEELRSQTINLQKLLGKVIIQLKEKCHLCANLEKQNNALEVQTNSLKDVVAITKDLLSIRNTEVVHLHMDIKSMEEKINFERERHNLILNRMAKAVKINEDLKAEYQTQLAIFPDLRASYEEKVEILQKENQRLLALVNQSNTN